MTLSPALALPPNRSPNHHPAQPEVPFAVKLAAPPIRVLKIGGGM